MRMIQRDLQQKLTADIRATRDRIETVVRPLDGAQLVERPEPNGWSVGEVLEHICVAGELYREPTRNLLHSARPDAAAPGREWKSTILGGMIAGALEKPRKLKAPRVFRPGPTPRNGVLEAFLAGEREVTAAMVAATLLDWSALKMRTPALPAFFPKMNLGDSFRIYTVHIARHAKQIERVASKVMRGR